MANDQITNRQRKRMTGTGGARRAAENIDSRKAAVDAAAEGKSPSKARDRKRRKGKRETQQDRADPSTIQKILDAIFG